jgi:RNA polymerase sigma-70 factor, ECF subfamily
MRLGELPDEDLFAEYRRAQPDERTRIADELFARYYQRVARWCLRFMGDREAAADLAQEVFLKAHRHLDDFRGTARFGTWLYSIARNEATNRLQRAAPRSEADDILRDLPTADEGPEAVAVRDSRARRLKAFLCATLDQTERTVFTLHYANDMSLNSITRLLGLDNPSGAKAYIVSARRKIARAAERLRTRGEEL